MFVLALRLALNHLMQRPLARLIVVFSVAVVLLINGMVFLLFQSFSKSLADVRSARYMTAYLDSSVAPNKEADVLSAIKKVPGVTGAQLVSKEVFVENFSKYFPQLSAELATLEADTVPRYIKVKADDETVKDKLAKLKGVEMVERNEKKFAGLIGALGTLRKLTAALIAGMSVALLCILVNHFKLRSVFQNQVRSALTLLGARSSEILLPFAIEGLIEGALGGLLAAVALLAYGQVFELHLNGLFGAIGYQPYHFQLLGLAFALAAIGAISGMIGSIWATIRVKT